MPTILSDIGCSSIWISCPLGVAMQYYANGECLARSDCGHGEYVISDGTSTLDRTCAPCTNNTYSAENNALSCTTHTLCLDANNSVFLATQGDAKSDSICRKIGKCRAGTYLDEYPKYEAFNSTHEVVEVSDVLCKSCQGRKIHGGRQFDRMHTFYHMRGRVIY